MDPYVTMSRFFGRVAAFALAPRSRHRFVPASPDDLAQFSIPRPSWATRALLPTHWRTDDVDRTVLVREQRWSEPREFDQPVVMVRVHAMIDARQVVDPALALTALVSETVLGDDALAGAILGGPHFCPPDVWHVLRMFSIQDGVVQIEVETQVEHRIVDALIEVLAGLVVRLEGARFDDRTIDVTKLLFENLRSSHRDAKVDALEHLLRRGGEGAQVARTIVEESGDPELAIVVLCQDDRVEGLARMVKDPTVPAALRARALIHLVQRSSPQGQGDAIMHALTSGVLPVVDEAIRIAGNLRYAPAGPSLERLILEATPPRAVAAVRALERIQGADAAPALLKALDRRDPTLVLAAADALGRVAGIDAVPTLDALAQRVVEADIRFAALAAIELIQARAPGASPGALSLARPTEGALSVPPAGRGSLSDVDPSGETDR